MRFLSPAAAAPEARLASPLARVLPEPTAEVRDLSLELAKFEVRGDVEEIRGAEVVRITPMRALVLAPWGTAVEGLDLTGALAALEVRGPRAHTALRRLTELDLDALPAVGAVAKVQVTVLRDGPDAFRLFVPQELGHYLAEVVLDALEGIR